jgi:hypothetical protein
VSLRGELRLGACTGGLSQRVGLVPLCAASRWSTSALLCSRGRERLDRLSLPEFARYHVGLRKDVPGRQHRLSAVCRGHPWLLDHLVYACASHAWPSVSVFHVFLRVLSNSSVGNGVVLGTCPLKALASTLGCSRPLLLGPFPRSCWGPLPPSFMKQAWTNKRNFLPPSCGFR